MAEVFIVIALAIGLGILVWATTDSPPPVRWGLIALGALILLVYMAKLAGMF